MIENVNTTEYINMLKSNSEFSIRFSEQYDNECIEYEIMRKSNNKKVAYFYIHTHDDITNVKLDNTVYEIYYNNDDDESDDQFLRIEYDFLSSYIFDDYDEFYSFVNNEQFDV